MLYVREAQGSLGQVVDRLEKAVAQNGFGILGVHDLKAKMLAKGVDFGPECRVYEVCNPAKAKIVLEADMSLSNVLPCRISVYEEAGSVKVSTLRPTELLKVLQCPGLEPVAQEVEDALVRIIEGACG